MNLVSKQPLPNNWNAKDDKSGTNLHVQFLTIFMMLMHPTLQCLRAIMEENGNDRGAAKSYLNHSPQTM
jgi:hypothetical protein